MFTGFVAIFIFPTVKDGIILLLFLIGQQVFFEVFQILCYTDFRLIRNEESEMAFDGIVVANLAYELKEKLINGRISGV